MQNRGMTRAFWKRGRGNDVFVLGESAYRVQDEHN